MFQVGPETIAKIAAYSSPSGSGSLLGHDQQVLLLAREGNFVSLSHESERRGMRKRGFSLARGTLPMRRTMSSCTPIARQFPTPSMNPPIKRLAHVFKVRPRLFIVTALGIFTGLFLPHSIASQLISRWLVAWNVGAWLYVLLAAVMMVRSSQRNMRHRAQLQDDGKHAILGLTVIAAIASLVAIAFELSVVKDMHGWTRGLHVALAGLTVLSSWSFIQIMFTLHYAHDYYMAACHGQKPGLMFPDDPDPDYGDFFYFSAVIGTSGQTADVSFVTKPMRRIGTLHCILAYLFNTTVLALLINIGASLF
jgi:uncharacterized membrane protein